MQERSHDDYSRDACNGQASSGHRPVRTGRPPRPTTRSALDAFLPSPCVQNHAANIMPLRNGDLGCVWFGGTQEGMPDISIYFSRLEKDGDQLVRSREAVGRSRALGAEPHPVSRSGRPPVAVLDGADLRQPGHRRRALPDLAEDGRTLGDRSRRSFEGAGRLWHLHPSAAGGARQRRLAAAGLPLPRHARPEMGRRPRHQRGQDLDRRGPDLERGSRCRTAPAAST